MVKFSCALVALLVVASEAYPAPQPDYNGKYNNLQETILCKKDLLFFKCGTLFELEASLVL